MNKKKPLIVICIAVIVIVAIVVIILVIRNNDNYELNNNNNGINSSVNVTGKLKQYVDALTDNYYIKYSGKFKDNYGELVTAIVEYTKSNDNFALRASEIDMHLICEGQRLYSISNKYKMIVEMPKTSIDISEYNLASDIGQTYLKSYKEEIESAEYDVEEYTFNGKTLKYYFKENDIRLIRYDLEDIKIIRLEKKTNTELLTKPLYNS